MTRFVDVTALTRMVGQVGMVAFLERIADQMRIDFARWESFDKCARVASHSDTGVIELMPVADGDHYAFKYVNGHPINATRGVSTVMAFGALAEVETGYPVLVSELTLTTAFRTAAASVIAAEALARPDARVMALIGCGAQSEFQALAFHTLLGIEEIRIFDIDKNAMRKLAAHLMRFPSLKVVSSASAAAAVKGADIVTTCTADKNWATILTPDMIEPGMHVNGVGGDCPGKTELHADVLRNAKIFVEYEPQTRIEGDIQQLPEDHPVHDLWRVIAGDSIGRDNAEQVTVFDSVGFALEDFSALTCVHALALELDEGMEIDLIPELNDPKDLFGRLLAVTVDNTPVKAA
ncbi:MAG: ornithine cyclodeaminase [Woeseia sp.]|nr:ornithine cyclodeaminase [Woeseia sp.]NNE61662.1 ornithine cyclodeaminase [Woeseia sp.]